MNDMSGQNRATKADLKMGRIAFLTSAHPWDDPRIFQKEAVSLAADNYDVTLVARKERSAVVNGVRCEALPAPANRLSRMLLTPFIVLIGLFNRRRQLPHDLVLGTVIIDASARTAYPQPSHRA